MTGFIAHRCNGLLCPIKFAGLLAIDDHPFEGEPLSEPGPHLTVEFRIVKTRLENSRGFSQGFASTVPSRGLEGWIHVPDHALSISEYYAVGGLFDNPGKQNETLDRLASLGEIMKQHHSSGVRSS